MEGLSVMVVSVSLSFHPHPCLPAGRLPSPLKGEGVEKLPIEGEGSGKWGQIYF